MKVRIKQGEKVWFENRMRFGGEVITLIPRTIPGQFGNDDIEVTPEMQFSRRTMEKIEEEKPKRGRPAKTGE